MKNFQKNLFYKLFNYFYIIIIISLVIKFKLFAFIIITLVTFYLLNHDDSYVKLIHMVFGKT